MDAMSRTAAVYGLTVPPDNDPIECFDEDTLPGEIHVTMAAIDPTAAPASDALPDSFKGATLKMIVLPPAFDDEDSDDEDFDMAKLLDADASDEEDSSDDEGMNGGPSDPERSPKILKQKKLLEDLKKAREEEDESEDDDMEIDAPNGLSAKAKGKARAVDMDDEDEDEDSDEDLELGEPKELVLCSLDLTKTYQQPLNITIPRGDRVYFKVSGTHTVYLTGNVTAPWDDEESDDDEYDLSPDEDELMMPEDEDESDELDDMEDPRIEEIDSDEEEVPKLLKAQEAKKGKNKRLADDEDENALAKATNPDITVNGEEKLSKKQRKKLKANGGNAVEVTATATSDKTAGGEDLGVKEVAVETTKAGSGKPDKKVQFAKTLVQGPSSSTAINGNTSKVDSTAKAEKPAIGQSTQGNAKPSLGVKTIQGVTVDDKKLGGGPQAKKGDRVSMRYIGKLEDKRVFDSNKKGTPFSFKLGSGEVIKGWDIGVAGMSAGGERRITIPSNLAYGNKALPDIPKNSTLIFDVKLLEIR